MHNTRTRTRNPSFLVKPDPNPTRSQKALLVMACWCPIMVKKICSNTVGPTVLNVQVMTNIFSTLYWSLVQSQDASISISYGSMRVFCSEASLKRRFFQYIKACFVEYAQLSEQKCLDHISQRGVDLLCFFHIFYFGFVMKHKYKHQNEQNKSAE